MIRRVISALLLAAAAPVGAQTYAIVNGTVALGDGSEPIPNGMVVIRDGRIVAAGGMRMDVARSAAPRSGREHYLPLQGGRGQTLPAVADDRLIHKIHGRLLATR